MYRNPKDQVRRQTKMSTTSRREFLISSAPLVAAPLLLPMMSSQLVAVTERELTDQTLAAFFARDQYQGDWRYCDKCFVMFFNGTESYGRCSAGGGHHPQGYQFFLPYGASLAET